MATGDTLVTYTPLAYEPQPTAFATIGYQFGHPTLDFTNGQSLNAFWTAIMPMNYVSTGVNIYVWYSCDVQVGNIQWQCRFERLNAAGPAINIDNSGIATSSDIQLAPSAANTIGKNTIVVTDGASMNSVTAGDLFRFKLIRFDSVASDAAGVVHLLGVEMREA